MGQGPFCGSVAFYATDGDGLLDEKGLYQCKYFPNGSYSVYAHFDMGLPTPSGGGSEFRLRVAPAPVGCGSLCEAGELIYSSTTHNCGFWNDTGIMTYSPPSSGTYCLIGVACGNEGWSCGGLIAIDDLWLGIYGDIDDWVLY
jgi:hypothetical protein